MAVFSRNEDGSWRRDDEHHENVLIDTARVPAPAGGNVCRKPLNYDLITSPV